MIEEHTMTDMTIDSPTADQDASDSFELVRTPLGHLRLTRADGQVFDHVSPVRSFPIQDPEHGIAMVCADGREVAWIARLQQLPPAQRALIVEELGAREFMPTILRIEDVSSYAVPSTWTVLTDRGATALVLRGEEDIRRLGPDALLVSDIHGIVFLIPNLPALDKHSKKILDRFL